MPDWFYRTVSQTMLFRLPAKTARDFVFSMLGTLARLPLGPQLIDFLGHMRADPRLQVDWRGIAFPTAVGIGSYLDPSGKAIAALSRFGVGFVEVGPIVAGDSTERTTIAVERDISGRTIVFPQPPQVSLEVVAAKLAAAPWLGVPRIARLGAMTADVGEATESCCRVVERLGSGEVQLFSLATFDIAANAHWPVEAWGKHVSDVCRTALSLSPSCPALLCVCPNALVDPARAARGTELINTAFAHGVHGVILDGASATKRGLEVGPAAFHNAIGLTRSMRRCLGPELLLIAAGGIEDPRQADELLAAGANLVQIDAGLVFSGPGLSKRINDSLLYRATKASASATTIRTTSGSSTPMFGPKTIATAPRARIVEYSWFWTALLGAAMFFGGLLTLAIAATRIVLPYDEAFVGLTREEMCGVNPQLLPFMAHDRVTLAGVMLATGVMYVGLSLYGIRHGLHWAHKSVIVSALVGFASFFLFLGFGYLEPLHAFVASVLLQFLLLGIVAKLAVFTPQQAPVVDADFIWRRGLWGQLLLIIHATLFIVAGVTISFIGVTRVFVEEDLNFLQTTTDELQAASPRMLPLVAHDRATLGGMLLSTGVAFLLPALWGFGRRSSWLWWSLLVAGLSAYLPAIGVHYAVGYNDLNHLIPAYSGLAIFLVGIALSRAYLTHSPLD